MKRLASWLLGAVLALAWAGTCAAAAFTVVVTPTSAFSGSVSGSPAYTVTASGNCAIGSQLIAVLTQSSNNSVQGFSDSLGSTYTNPKNWTLNTRRQGIWLTTLTSAVVSGSTTFPVNETTAGRASLIVICATGADTLDVIGTGVANGAGTSSSTTHTPGSAASTINIAFLWRSGSPTGFTEGAGWTTIQTVNNTSNNILTAAYQITTSTSPLTYAPSWSGSVASESATISFTTGGGAVTPRGTLMGVLP